MTDNGPSRGTKKLPVYSRAELMQALGLEADEIDLLLADPAGAESMLAMLSGMLDHLRSIYDLDEQRIAGYLKRHHETFGTSSLEYMLRYEDGPVLVGRFLASEAYSVW